MSTQTSTKIRLVRCPRCWRILAELPNVSLYKCGGCGTTLEAKIQACDANHAELSSRDSNISPRTQRDGVVEEKEATLSSPDNDGIRCREDGGDSRLGLSSQEKCGVVKEGESLAGYSAGSCPVESSLEKDSVNCGKSVSKSRGGSGEWSRRSSDVVGEPPRVWREADDDEFIDEIRHLPDLEDEEAIFAGDSEDSEVDEHGCIASQSNGKSEARLDSDSGFISNENLLLSEARQKEVGDEEQRNESLASFYLTCPENEHKDHSVRESTRNYGRISSIDKLASSSLADLSSKLVSKNNCYAYDGSESSYDGTDDQIHYHFPTRRERVHRATEIGHSGSEKSTEANEYMSRYNTRLNRHGDAPRLWQTFGDPVARHKAVSPSSYKCSLLPPCPGFDSSEKVLYSEADKADLLRRVYELKDELNRIRFPNVATSRSSPGIPATKFDLSHYDHIASEEDLCSGLNRRLDEVAHYCSCLHCRHQEHRRNSCCAASPQHSELSLSGPDDELRDAIKRLRLKLVKQHLLPVAGGAPLISCYNCWELIQLPANLLLFKRRCHRLRCSACCEVLKFSLQKGTRLVPAMSNPLQKQTKIIPQSHIEHHSS